MRRRLLPILILLGASLGCGADPDVIGPEGGTVSVAGGPTLEFPAGAVSQEIHVVLEKIALPSDAPFTAVSEVWSCAPNGTDFAQPVRVTMPYSDSDPASLIFYWSAGSPEYRRVEDAQISDGVATGTIRHFSSGFVGRPQ